MFAGLIAALLCYGLLLARFWFVIDDAFITFRYSRNLAQGLGIRYNASESPPVEGYSNFLWMVLCAGFEALHLDPVIFAPLSAAICGAVLIALVHRRLATLEFSPLIQIVGILFLALFPPMGLWGSTGLETMAFALAIFTTVDALILRPVKPAIIQAILGGIALSLVRTEGPAWVAVIFVLGGMSRFWDGQWRESGKELFTAFFSIVLAFAAYFGWRYSYFGTIVSNTAAAKSAILSLRWNRGVNYVLSYFATFASLLPVLFGGGICALRGSRRGMWLAIAALSCAFPAYGIVVTGDFMPMGRFLLPAAPFWALLAARLVAAIHRQLKPSSAAGSPWFVAAVVLVAVHIGAQLAPAWNVHLVPRSVLEQFRFRFNTPTFMTEFDVWQDQKANAKEWTALGHGLRKYCEEMQPKLQSPSVVMGAIGAAGYYSNLHVYDRHGLVTPEVANRPVGRDEPLLSAGHDRRVAPEFFLKDKATILRYRQLSGVTEAANASAKQRMAAELETAQEQNPELGTYGVDSFCFRGPGTDGLGDYLVMWVRMGE